MRLLQRRDELHERGQPVLRVELQWTRSRISGKIIFIVKDQIENVLLKGQFFSESRIQDTYRNKSIQKSVNDFTHFGRFKEKKSKW